MYTELKYVSYCPLRVIYNSKVGMRGVIGACGPSNKGKTRSCSNCSLEIDIGEYEMHLKRCLYMPIVCDLCQIKISERQFLYWHKINNCPNVRECLKCLSYFSILEAPKNQEKVQHNCQESNPNHKLAFLDIYDETERDNVMPLLKLHENGFLSLQIGSSIFQSDTPLKPMEFKSYNLVSYDKKDEMDEKMETTFSQLPDYILELSFHKKMLGCGDSVGLCWRFYNDSFKTHYSSQFIEGSKADSIDKLILLSQKGMRMVSDKRICCLHPYENPEKPEKL